MGVTTLKNPAVKAGRQPILRFDNAKHLQVWLNSPVRKKLMEPINKITDLASYSESEATGLETWFDIPGQRVTPPPRWKMVITTCIAIYPISLAYGAFVATRVVHWPLAYKSLFLPVFAPIILTYLFMPFLTQHVLKRWLYKVPN